MERVIGACGTGSTLNCASRQPWRKSSCYIKILAMISCWRCTARRSHGLALRAGRGRSTAFTAELGRGLST
jgi:hypothetical protein